MNLNHKDRILIENPFKPGKFTHRRIRKIRAPRFHVGQRFKVLIEKTWFEIDQESADTRNGVTTWKTK
jgi:hypothetical protein